MILITDIDVEKQQFLTLKIQVLYCVSIMETFKNVAPYDSIARLHFHQHCQLFGISLI